jgi:hypothetical protein
MALSVLEEAIAPVYEAANKLDFCKLLGLSREYIGLKLYRAAEFMGIAPARLKNLETGYFRIMPTEAELNAIAQLYDLPYGTVKRKAQEHVKLRQKVKKVKFKDDDDM